MQKISARIESTPLEVTALDGSAAVVAGCYLRSVTGPAISWAGKIAGRSESPARFASSTAARTFAAAHGIEVVQ